MTNPIIIGAGISGLIAALELEKAGFAPIIIEASDRVGGRIKTDTIDGLKLDHGFQVLLTAYPEAQYYLDYDKLDFIRFSPGSVIYKDSKPTKIGDPQRDISFLWPTITASIGSLRDKFLILKLSKMLQKKSIEAIFSDVEKTTLYYLKDFGFSDKMIHHFFQPFFAGIFLEEDLSTSSKMFEFVYKMFSTGDAAVPKAGMQAIPDQLAAQLKNTNIRLNTTVKSITNKTINLGNGESITAEHIIIATDPSPFFQGKSTTVYWKSCYTIYLEADKSVLNETIIGLLPNKNLFINNFHFLEDVFNSDKSVISVTVVKDHKLSEDELISKVKDELQEHCGIATERVIKIFHIKKALPNLSDLKLEPSNESITLAPGVQVCGDHLAYGSLNAAMASGRLAAEAVINS